MDYLELFARHREQSLVGRYLPPDRIESLIRRFEKVGEVIRIGQSVKHRPLYCCRAGNGNTAVLMWSQMHGNESTTTKALFDFFNFISSDDPLAVLLLKHFTFHMVPMLNPDGSQAYTRENANGIDLNRDFCNLAQPESTALFNYFNKIESHYCFNLHDQRTIYGVGDTGKPATVSFLSPSYNEAREVNRVRRKAMDVIVVMTRAISQYIPGQIGRFDDSFNVNCVGDTFQAAGVATILFEAGHYPGDYQREETRKYIFTALVSGLRHIRENDVVSNGIEEYLHIPQNKINFYDFVYKNVKINCDGIEKITNFGAQFSEALTEGEITFEARIAETGIADDIFGHEVFDAQGETYLDDRRGKPLLDDKADFYLGNRQFVNGKPVTS